MQKIKAISIHAFRGIPDLELIVDGKNIILKGENATGKSSIVEAFEYFFTGNLATFAGEGTQSLSLQKHAPHKNFKKEDVSIKITFGPGNIELERTFETNLLPPSSLEQYFKAAQKGTFVLRRSQILKFIVSPPGDRFRAIATLIGGEQLDDIELAFKKSYEEVQNTIIAKRQKAVDILTNLSSSLGKTVTNITEALSQLNQKLFGVGLVQLKTFDEIGMVGEGFLKTLKESTDFERIVQLGEIIEELSRFESEDDILEPITELNKALKPFFEEKARRDFLLQEFLTKGQQAVKAEEKNECPLCGQEIDRVKLLEQVNHRLQILQELSKEASEIRHLVSEIDHKLNSLQENVENVCLSIKNNEALEGVRVNLIKAIRQLSKFQERVKSAKELKITDELPVEKLNVTLIKIKQLVEYAVKKSKMQFKKIGVPIDWKKKMEMVNLANRVSVLVKELMQIEKELALEESQQKIAKEVYETFSVTKKAKISHVYDAIKGDVNSFYSTLHPNEPHKNIELGVSSKRRASTELRMESFGSIEDPRAFSSEGHLDSLGLCIFLAFVKKFNEDCKFIVLDDVVTTIDSQHRRFICKLLYEQFKEYQLFVTTHDSIWYEQLCDYQHAYGVSGNFKNLEIVKWTLDAGPIIVPYKPRWERIKNRIESGDKLGASIEGRSYLEWLLKKICENMMARPVFKTGKYTVADLFGPAKARIVEMVRDSAFKATILTRFRDLETNALMTNLMAHDNLEAKNASADEVRDFCNAIHSLHLALCCPDCNTFLKYYPDMKKIRCPNSHCRQQIDIACRNN
jgi:recombinational DNA repair ATPase RecF